MAQTAHLWQVFVVADSSYGGMGSLMGGMLPNPQQGMVQGMGSPMQSPMAQGMGPTLKSNPSGIPHDSPSCWSRNSGTAHLFFRNVVTNRFISRLHALSMCCSWQLVDAMNTTATFCAVNIDVIFWGQVFCFHWLAQPAWCTNWRYPAQYFNCVSSSRSMCGLFFAAISLIFKLPA